MSYRTFSLHQLGWRSAYAQQLTLADFETGYPARVMAAHGGRLDVLSSRGSASLPFPAEPVGNDVVVGDWIWLDDATDGVLRVLARHSRVARVHVQGGHRRPPAAANLDVLFIVWSCQAEFQPARLLRYLALANGSGVTPVVVATGVDRAGRAEQLATAARGLLPSLAVVHAPSGSSEGLSDLAPWLLPGLTVAFVGTASAGRSLVMRRVLGPAGDAPRAAMLRGMLPSPAGAWVMETPELRQWCLGTAEPVPDAVFEAA
ncbi:GTPase RsgA [Dyella sp. C9]|uniref:GTPase RsgA n=1 Tax=Dyella sp. C9 TaxID=2202154 RepID=UPI000DEF7E3A|nr:GTPase RsgA [Dyella sp. C9]